MACSQTRSSSSSSRAIRHTDSFVNTRVDPTHGSSSLIRHTDPLLSLAVDPIDNRFGEFQTQACLFFFFTGTKPFHPLTSIAFVVNIHSRVSILPSVDNEYIFHPSACSRSALLSKAELCTLDLIAAQSSTAISESIRHFVRIAPIKINSSFHSYRPCRSSHNDESPPWSPDNF